MRADDRDQQRGDSIDISRATLVNWYVQLGSKVQVIIDAMKAQLLKETLICADETTMRALREEDRQAQSKSYMWVYRRGQFTDLSGGDLRLSPDGSGF